MTNGEQNERKTTMTKLKQYYQFALVALGIAAFAPLAQAGTVSGSDVIYLKDGKAYSDEACVMRAEIQTEPMASSVTAPAHATAAVYTNGLLSADGIVWSNGTATVVYTADDGYCFADGSKAITNLKIG